ncbi:hypothetical protein Hanom_Chr05g00426051 [Helianthus anomalus]
MDGGAVMVGWTYTLFPSLWGRGRKRDENMKNMFQFHLKGGWEGKGKKIWPNIHTPKLERLGEKIFLSLPLPSPY